MGRFRHPITVQAFEPVGEELDTHRVKRTRYAPPIDIEDCAFAPLPQSEESLEPRRDKVIDYAHLWGGKWDAPLERRWKIAVPGHGTFIVSDIVERWKNPHNGRKPGFEAHLKDVEG